MIDLKQKTTIELFHYCQVHNIIHPLDDYKVWVDKKEKMIELITKYLTNGP